MRGIIFLILSGLLHLRVVKRHLMFYMVRLEGNRLLFLLTILVNSVFILVLRKMYSHGLTALLACPNQKHTKLTIGCICR